MTGWRLGWTIVPDDLVDAVERLAQNLFISPPALPQHAALEAFECRAALDGYVATYARNRQVLLDRLPEAGFGRLAPADGAFYVYADIGDLAADSQALCEAMLRDAAVAATPGIDFDPRRGHRFVRFSFAGAAADIAEAADRLFAAPRRRPLADAAAPGHEKRVDRGAGHAPPAPYIPSCQPHGDRK